MKVGTFTKFAAWAHRKWWGLPGPKDIARDQKGLAQTRATLAGLGG
ncbi:MAG: hypothetical protein JNK82_00250, partial [Myxococcaceae bacterium]|nr:hypothetical protein [Myxococcaceae bacterium]